MKVWFTFRYSFKSFILENQDAGIKNLGSQVDNMKVCYIPLFCEFSTFEKQDACIKHVGILADY